MIDTVYKRILFCTDFSKNAEFAFSFAIDAAQRRPGSQLFLLHVLPEAEARFWGTYVSEIDNVDKKAKQMMDEKIEKAYTSSLPSGVDLQIEFRVGKDSQQILEFAKEKEIDLIIIGRHGRSHLQKPFFGNVTEKIVRKANCSVLVVPLSYQKRMES